MGKDNNKKEKKVKKPLKENTPKKPPEFTLKFVKDFKQIIKGAKVLLKDVQLDFGKDSFRINAVDLTRSTSYLLKMKKEAFESYMPGDQEIFVNLVELENLLNRMFPDDELRLNLDPDKNRLILLFSGKLKRSFELFTLDNAEDIKKIADFSEKARNLKVEALENTISFTMKSKLFFEILKDLKAMESTVLNIMINEKKGTIEMNGTREMVNDKYHVPLEEGDLVYNIDINEDCDSFYSVNFLEKIFTSGIAFDEVVFSLAKDFPLVCHFEMENIELTAILAPQEENDDEFGENEENQFDNEVGDEEEFAGI